MNIRNIFKHRDRRRILGDFGERAAARMLKKKGYRILARSYMTDEAEIDLICETKDTVVYVEVKTRTQTDAPYIPRPAAAVTPEKQRKILRAARVFRGRGYVGKQQRFDVVEVYTDGGEPPHILRICHIEGAFTRDTAYPRHS